MRKLIFTATLLFSFNANAANYNCGFKPFKPMQCIHGEYICQCSGFGQCQWVLQGC